MVPTVSGVTHAEESLGPYDEMLRVHCGQLRAFPQMRNDALPCTSQPGPCTLMCAQPLPQLSLVRVETEQGSG